MTQGSKWQLSNTKPYHSRYISKWAAVALTFLLWYLTPYDLYSSQDVHADHVLLTNNSGISVTWVHEQVVNNAYWFIAWTYTILMFLCLQMANQWNACCLFYPDGFTTWHPSSYPFLSDAVQKQLPQLIHFLSKIDEKKSKSRIIMNIEIDSPIQ